MGTAYGGGTYPRGTGSIYLMDTFCRPNDNYILECLFNAAIFFVCSHGEDAGVKCYEDCKEYRLSSLICMTYYSFVFS